jgi:hypothetical protein
LNPLDFYVWGNLKAFAYSAKVHNMDTLHQLIVNTCQTIRNYPGIVDRAGESMIRCAQARINPHGEYSEHLL